jgi:hypothetical protein
LIYFVNRPTSLDPVSLKGKNGMEDVQKLVGEVKALIQEGKSGEEVCQFLSPWLRGDTGIAEELAEELARIPHETTVRILYRMLKGAEEKKLQKTIKRSLYRLKGKGIRVDDVSSDQGRSILRPLQTEPPEGFGTGIDLRGQRLLMLAVPRTGRGMRVMHGVVSDTQGLINFVGEEMTRREFRGFFENLQEKSPFPLVKMDAPYVGFLFSEAYRLTLERKGTPPQDYLHVKGEIEGVKREHAFPLIYTFLSKDEIEREERRLQRGGELLKDELFVTWGIEEDAIRPYADGIVAAQESKLYLHPNQKEARYQEVYLKAMTELFSEEMKVLYRHRLEETAYLFHQLGKTEEAKTALSVAVDLEKPLNPIQPNPFLFQLVARSIQTLLAETREKEKRDPALIVKP